MKKKITMFALFNALMIPLTTYADTPMELTIVTPTRFSSIYETASVNVTVITAEDIRKNSAKTIPALLAQHAGVQVRSSDGTSDMSIDMRGFGISGSQNTLVLLDGQKLNDIELTSIRWSSIPLDSIERIEIVKGGGAVLYGAGASGGTINIITKKSGKHSKGIASFDLGSYNTRELQLSLGTKEERTGIHISASTLKSDNYRINNNITQSSLEADVRTEVGNGDVVLKFGGDNQNLRYPGARRVDPSAGQDQLASDRRGTDTPFDYGKRQGGHISLGTSQQLDAGDFAAEIGYRKKNAQAYYDFGGSPLYLDTKLNLLSFAPRMKVQHQLWAFDNELVVGADFADWDYDSIRSDSPATTGTPNANILAKQLNRALYAQNIFMLNEKSRLLLGARTQRTDYSARDTENAASYASGNQTRRVNVYELGLRYDFNPTLSLFGHIGRSFRMATVDEIFDQYGVCDPITWICNSKISMLAPQTSQDKEVGLEYRSGVSRMRTTLYYMDLENEIHYNAIAFANMNLSPTRRYGLEMEGGRALGDTFEITAAYSYTVAKFREGVYSGVDVSGNNIPLVPRQRAALGLSWNLSGKTALSSEVLYVGEQYYDNDQTNTFASRMPAYNTVDIKLSHQAVHWTWVAAVNNLFNEKYFTYAVSSTSSPGTYNAYPMQERSFSLRAKYRF